MASKKTSSRGKSAAASEKERKNREAHSRQQFWAIVVFAVAVFIMATTLIEGQNVWNWIHNFFLGMFGWSAYLIAPLLFYISIMTTLDKPIGLVGHKVWQTMLLICLLSGATQVFGSGIPNGNLIEKFLSLFQNGIDGHGGGAVSGIFGLPLLYWFGPTGAKVTMVLLIFVVIMVLTGGTLRRSMSPTPRSVSSSASCGRNRWSRNKASRTLTSTSLLPGRNRPTTSRPF